MYPLANVAARAARARSVFSSFIAISVHHWRADHLFEPAGGRVIRREFLDVTHFVFEDRPEVRDDGEKIDTAGLVARDGGFERESCLRQDGVPVHARKPDGGRRHLGFLLDACLKAKPGGVESAAGLFRATELLGDGRRST